MTSSTPPPLRSSWRSAARTASRFALIDTGYDPDSPDEVQRRTDEELEWKRQQGIYRMEEILDKQGYHFPGD